MSLTNRQLLRWTLGFLRPVRKEAVLACLYLGLWTAAEIVTVRVTAEAVNRIEGLHPTAAAAGGPAWRWVVGEESAAAALRTTVLLLAGFTVLMGVLRYLREVANMRLSMDMVFHIREAVYDKLQRAGFAFHDAISTGELINRALSDLQHVRAFVNTALLVSLEIVLIVGGYLALLLSRSPWVAGLALAPLPVWTWIMLRFSRRAQPASEEVMKAGDRDLALITENIAGVHVVRAFATEAIEIRKYEGNCEDFFARVMRRVGLFADFVPVMRGIATASHLTLFLAAGVLIIRGRFAAGDILMLGSAMGAILSRLQQISVINDQYQNAIVSARRLHEVLHAPPSVRQRPDARPLPDGPADVRFEHVTFGYDPARPVLHDVSFHVPAGATVAVVGPTGAGKTTLVSLLARFYDPQGGRILVGGTDIRDLTLESLRRRVAYVFQETYLFSDTVEANIAYGRPAVRGGPVEAAARLAQAHDFIAALPRGYLTAVGERGTTLSGGQRQRLAIARAIAADPRILVLDDATAAVDSETEHAIHRALELVMEHCTTFVIAHRVSTVRNADLVLVLEAGRIVEAGTHAELLARGGHYRRIVDLQLRGDDEPEDRRSHMDRMTDLGRRRPAPLPLENPPDEP